MNIQIRRHSLAYRDIGILPSMLTRLPRLRVTVLSTGLRLAHLTFPERLRGGLTGAYLPLDAAAQEADRRSHNGTL